MKALLVIAVCTGAVILTGCSRESRDDVIERTAKAAKELNGSEKGESTPDIVAEQKRKEKIRQNTQWTAENQALHPIEYCQAQLEEVANYSKRLEVRAHEIAVAQSAAKRKISELGGQISSLSKLLGQAKSAYREADAANKWPMPLNGYQIGKEKAQQTIVETHQRLKESERVVATQKNNLLKLEAKARQIALEQKNLVTLKERIQTTISEIKMKKAIDGEKNIGVALNAINDSMNALSSDSAEPSLDDLLIPASESARKEAFEAIMAN